MMKPGELPPERQPGVPAPPERHNAPFPEPEVTPDPGSGVYPDPQWPPDYTPENPPPSPPPYEPPYQPPSWYPAPPYMDDLDKPFWQQGTWWTLIGGGITTWGAVWVSWTEHHLTAGVWVTALGATAVLLQNFFQRRGTVQATVKMGERLAEHINTLVAPANCSGQPGGDTAPPNAGKQ